MKRSKSIKIRVTEGEYLRLHSLAGTRGISALLRRAIGIDQSHEKTERLMVVAEIARARNILNQIARNCERKPLPEQIEILAALLSVERTLSTFKGG